MRNNLGFVYKHLTNDFEQIVNALGFRNYEDLKEIMKFSLVHDKDQLDLLNVWSSADETCSLSLLAK